MFLGICSVERKYAGSMAQRRRPCDDYAIYCVVQSVFLSLKPGTIVQRFLISLKSISDILLTFHIAWKYTSTVTSKVPLKSRVVNDFQQKLGLKYMHFYVIGKAKG